MFNKSRSLALRAMKSSLSHCDAWSIQRSALSVSMISFACVEASLPPEGNITKKPFSCGYSSLV